jgi:hypothetical protein
MAKDDPLSLIRARKAEMAAQRAKEQAERARLDAEAAARAKEEEELAVAERVYARLAGKPVESLVSEETPERKSAPAAGGTPRPEGIPTVPEMVTQLLLDAEQRGARGLKSSEIMAGIDSRWWPGVSVNHVMPTVYRCISRNYWFAKEGKLIVRLRGGQPPRRHASSSQLKLVS